MTTERHKKQKGKTTNEIWGNLKENKTGVINDPLGQPTVSAGSDCRLSLKFWDGRTDTLCENSDHYRPELWSVDQLDKRSK